MTTNIINKSKSDMEKAITAFQKEIAKLRTGRASLAVLDDVRVDYYGQMVPLNQVATLSVPEPRMITIAPWESSQISAIEKAIDKANLGFTPSNDGKIVRLPIPPLTEERRKDIVKSLKAHAEDSRVSVRHARRDALDELKKMEKNSGLAEDDSKKASQNIQKVTDDFIKRIDDIVKKKEEEIMQV